MSGWEGDAGVGEELGLISEQKLDGGNWIGNSEQPLGDSGRGGEGESYL